MAFDSKHVLNQAIKYLAGAAQARAAGGWIPPKERAKQEQAQQKQFIADKKEREKNLAAFQKGNHPDVPHVVYHGTGTEHDGDFRVPSFFTSDPQGAEWYAKNRGDNPQIFPVHLSMKKPLDTRSKEGIFKLSSIAHNAGVHGELKETPKGWQFTSNDIAEHSPYEGDNPLDLLYIPKVRNALYQNGHDGVIASDVLANDEIPTFIPLHPQQIKSATGNQGTFNLSASDITKSEGGPILSKQYPTHYMPNVGRQVMNAGGTPDDVNKAGLYSKASRIAAALPQKKAKGAQMVAALKDPKRGVKKEELVNAGLMTHEGAVHPDWADRSVTTDELAQHLRDQMPKIEETVLGRTIKGTPYPEEYTKIEQSIIDKYKPELDHYRQLYMDTSLGQPERNAALQAGYKLQDQMWAEMDTALPDRDLRGQQAKDIEVPTKYHEWTLPGGENYREVLLKLPHEKKQRVGVTSTGHIFTEEELSDPIVRRTAEKIGLTMEDRMMPTMQPFKSQHWDDPNVLAHIRMSDRTGPNGEKILHVEELQSDWGQQGKKEGFAQSLDPKIIDQLKSDLSLAQFKKEDARKAFNDVYENIFRENLKKYYANAPTEYDLPNALKEYDKNVKSAPPERKFQEYKGNFLRDRDSFTPEQQDMLQDAHDAYVDSHHLHNEAKNKHDEYISSSNGIPSAPYVTSTEGWTDLALKRVLKEAAEGGYDKIVWTPGAEQAKRYDLSNHVDRLVLHGEKGQGHLLGYKDGDDVFSQPLNDVEKELPNFVGKDVAAKLLEQEPYSSKYNTTPRRELMGQDLSLGGEGMKGYYDKIVPSRLQALAKKHDPNATIKMTEPLLPSVVKGRATNPLISAPSIDVTPQMRESIMKGQEAYKRGGMVSPRHPALSLPGIHIREEQHGQPIFTGRL